MFEWSRLQGWSKMVHHVQGSMADGAASARAGRAAGEAGGGGWPTASRIDAQRDRRHSRQQTEGRHSIFKKKSSQVKSTHTHETDLTHSVTHTHLAIGERCQKTTPPASHAHTRAATRLGDHRLRDLHRPLRQRLRPSRPQQKQARREIWLRHGLCRFEPATRIGVLHMVI